MVFSKRQSGRRANPLAARANSFRPRVEDLEDRTLLTAIPIQLLDVNPGVLSSNANSYIVLNNNTMLFAADDGTHGSELWRTDGTASGTVLVSDINPGSSPSNPTNFTPFNGRMFFTATTATNGTELWVTNGTQQSTLLVKDINPGTASSSPTNLTVFNGALYFAANDGTHGNELWKSDGTAGGTNLFADIDPGIGDSNPDKLTVSSGFLFFSANDGTTGSAHGTELWRTDGVDGTPAHTTLVADLNPGTASSFPSRLTDFGGTLYFAAFTPGSGNELWHVTGAGAPLTNDINPGAGSSSPSNLAISNNHLFMAANDGTHGNELFEVATPGAVPTLVADINPIGDSNPVQLTNFNNVVYFRANDNVHGNELWRSDGTTTTLVKDINPGSADSNPAFFTAVGATLYFQANDGVHGVELWKTDGTTAGTVLVADINPNGDANPTQLTNFNGTLFFRATNGVSGLEPWRVVNDFIVTGSDFGSLPNVSVFDGTTNTLILSIQAYDPGFRGGVRVGVGDVNGDGIPDIVTAPGTNGGPDIRIYNGGSGKQIGEFLAYNVGFTGGEYVSVADINGDGIGDVVVSPDRTGGPDIRVFDGLRLNLIEEFFAYNVAFTGGVRVATGDFNGDGTPDIITAPGQGGGPDVRVFNGKINGQLISEVFAYSAAFTGGVYVAAGDLNGDGKSDIITGAGQSGGPEVKAFAGGTLAVLDDFFAYGAAFTGGVRVAGINDVNGDGKADIVTGPGPGGGPDIRVFSGLSGGSAILLKEFLAGDPANTNGTYVGASRSS